MNINQDIIDRFQRIQTEVNDTDTEIESSKHSQALAFRILLKYVDTNIVVAAEHDIIYLLNSLDEIVNITDEEIKDLVLAGVRFSEYDGLEMFV